MKSGSCLAAIGGTVTLHAAVAVVAIRLLAQPDALPPTPEPPLIQAHLAPQALPAAPPPPTPAPLPAPAKPHTPRHTAPQPAPARPVAKASMPPTQAPAAPAVPAEATPAPAPATPIAAQPAPQAALQPPAPAAAVKAGPSIPASYAASNRKPDYPLISRRYGDQGTVVLSVYVKADGSAGDVQIKTSSGHPLLDESAKTAVQDWRFNPATIDGKPIAFWYQIPIPFKLSNSQHN